MVHHDRLEGLLARISKQFRLEFARKDDLGNIVDLFKDVWNIPKTREALERRFLYRFWENSLSGKGEGLLLCHAKDELVGFGGMLHTEVWDRGQGRTAGFGIDLVVKPSYRGLGVAHLLQRRLNNSIDFALEGNLNADAQAVMAGMGAREIRNCTVFRRWLRLSDFLHWDTLRDGCITRLTQVDDRFDRLWERSREAYSPIARRDSAVIDWRYRKQPSRRFNIHGIFENNELSGYFVTTFESLEGPLKKAILVDFLFVPSTEERLVSWFRIMLSRLARAGALCVDAVATHREFRKVLERLHFRSKEHDPGFMVHETEYTKGRDDLYEANSWYLTYGDSDFYI